MLRTPDPTKCSMSGRCLKTGDVFVPQTFTIQAKNAKGEDITEGGMPFQVYVVLTGKPKAKKKNANPSRRSRTMRTTNPPLQMRRRSRGFLHGVH